MNKIERRAFLQSSGLGAITLAASQQKSRAANRSEKLVIGVIGTGGMGTAHLKSLAQRKDAEVAYVCDVDKDRLAAATGTVASLAGNSPTPVNDLRIALDDRNVDCSAPARHW